MDWISKEKREQAEAERAETGILFDIILLYANTPPHPIENLRLIEKELFSSTYYRDDDTQRWERYFTQEELHSHIEMVVGIGGLGLEKAKEIYLDENQKNQFISGVLGYVPYESPHFSEKKLYRKHFDAAFYSVFGYTVSSRCPCSHAKKEALEKAGYLLAGIDFDGLTDATGQQIYIDEELIKPRWIKKRINCLQCDHIHFVAILEDLAKGSYHLLSESGIVAGYSKTTVTEAQFIGNGKGPIGIRNSYSFTENEAAFPGYLRGLPCNLLIEMLSEGPHAQKIKRCPHCGKFFFAKDTKRIICYETECLQKMERTKKKRQREKDPVKYI